MPESPGEYRFINDHRHEFRIATMCRVHQEVARGGFYQWLHKPVSDRTIEDQRLLGKIRGSYVASSGVYGSLRVCGDLREAGRAAVSTESPRSCAPIESRRARLPNHPDASLDVPRSLRRTDCNGSSLSMHQIRAWVTDITYLRTWHGWLYLAVVLDLYSRKVIGWSMKPTLARELVLDALLMAVWRRKPAQPVIVHSDQGSQYGSDDWRRFCRSHRFAAQYEPDRQLLGQRRC